MPETQMQCRHVFIDGRRCAAACLGHEPFCYYHHTTRRPVQNLPARRRRSSTFTLPELEDRSAIQLALAEVLQRIASNDIDPKRAGHLLFGLQIATMLLPKRDPKDKTEPRTVSEITHDEELGDLAPAQEVGTDREPSAWEIVLNRMEEMDNQEDDTLPTLQAAASPHSEPKTLNSKLLNKNAFAHSRTKPALAPQHAKLLAHPRVPTQSKTPPRGHHAPQPTPPARRCPPVAPPAHALRPAARRRRSRLQSRRAASPGAGPRPAC